MDLREQLSRTPAAKQWEKIGLKHHHGIVVPLFALVSEKSAGIGEFSDLLPLIDWCRSVGLDVIQLLPLNDTDLENSPYSAISSIALNPIHLSLHRLPFVQEDHTLLMELPFIPYSERIDYNNVRSKKYQFLQFYLEKVKSKIINLEDFQHFLKSHSDWLPTYCLFKILRKKHNYSAWTSWNLPFNEALLQEYANEIIDLSLIQYLCFLQMKEVKKYAEDNHLYIKGDIPILINRDSADVWQYPQLFDLNYSAGAPPDQYSTTGQNWGFAVYKWDIMEQDNYTWWKRRLHVAEEIYHIYRIDHAVGFYRIWSIPTNHPPNEGHFIPEDSSTWIAHGEKVMKMMLTSSLLPIAEDLGTVPPEVRNSLTQLGICGTKVIRWERNWNTDRSFIPFDQYSPISMTTVSTHDSDTLQAWWEKSPEEAQMFAKFKNWQYQPSLSNQQLCEILKDSHHTSSIFHINLLNEYLALIPNMHWHNREDERINTPGTISDKNWTYHFRPTLEEIISNVLLRNLLGDFIP